MQFIEMGTNNTENTGLPALTFTCRMHGHASHKGNVTAIKATNTETPTETETNYDLCKRLIDNVKTCQEDRR